MNGQPVYAFIIDVPDSWSDKEHEDLYNLICRFSFMLIKDDGNPYKSRYAFITAHHYEDIDALRRDFDISNDVTITDGSQYDLSKV